MRCGLKVVTLVICNERTSAGIVGYKGGSDVCIGRALVGSNKAASLRQEQCASIYDPIFKDINAPLDARSIGIPRSGLDARAALATYAEYRQAKRAERMQR